MSQINSEKAEKYKMMPLKRDSEKDYEPPPQLNKMISEEFKDSIVGSQHGWLASQHEIENEVEDPAITNKKHPIEEFKITPDVFKTVNNAFETPTDKSKGKRRLNFGIIILYLEENVVEGVSFTFKREFENVLNRKSIDTTPELTSKPGLQKIINPPKPFYKSIIAITAAIILQNYWRDYRKRRMQRVSDPE